MSESSAPRAATPVRRKRGAGARLRLPILLVVVLVGLLGAWRIWQLFAPFSFTVEVLPDPDLTGEGAAGLLLLDSGELLSMFEYELRLAGSGEVVTSPALAPARERRAKASVKGAQRRRAVRAENVVGVLRYPGADDGRLSFELREAAFQDGRLRQVLTNDAAALFLGESVTTFVAVKNQHGDPVPGLSGLMRADIHPQPDKPSVYDVPIQIDDLLYRLGRAEESYRIEMLRSEDGTRWTVEFPLRWFVAAGTDPHVVQVQEQVATLVPTPQVSAVEPARVSLASGWDGHLRVTGRNLERVGAATLERGKQTVNCQIVTRAQESLDLSVTPAQLLPGAWNLVLVSGADQEPARVASALRVEAGLWWELPRAGQRLPAGDEVELSWGSSGLEGQVVIEATAEGAAGDWMRVFAGPLSAGSARWSTVGLGPGSYVLRMTAPGQAGVAPLQRRIQLEPPPTLNVVVRFRKGGQPFGNVRQVIVGDEAFEPPADPMIWRLSLPPGRHMLRVRGALLPTKLYPIEVNSEGQQIEVDLGD